MSGIIDLRSDTVTLPTSQMREAMASAPLGDDVFCEDPTVNLLQEESADLLGFEAGLFTPTGSMGNQVAVNVHTQQGQEVICEASSHVLDYELAMMSAFSGVMPRALVGKDGVITAKQIEEAIRPSAYYCAPTGLICLENTHNMAGGRIFPREEIEKILALAQARQLPVHLDGARIFNAAAALGEPVKNLAQGFSSVMFCFSKGLSAPVGSMLVGDKAFIHEARTVRKRLGGGMRQVGVIAAASRVALKEMPGRLRDDHENAKKLADGLSEIKGIAMDAKTVQTNIVIFGLEDMDSGAFLSKLQGEGVLAVPRSQTRVRFVTHRGIVSEDIPKALEAVRKVMA